MPYSDFDLEFQALLNYVSQEHSFDLSVYRDNFLARKITHRMHDLNIKHYHEYNKYLELHPEEFAPLVNIIENNTTCFLRDSASWSFLSNQIVSQIIANKLSHEPIRVWSAGCASGEETYSLGMILAEALGLEQYCQRVQIYGTDIDEEALTQARQGSYLSYVVTGIPADFLKKYFNPVNDQYIASTDLRSPIIFQRHNMTKGVPKRSIDLLACRNTLIYFNLKGQIKTLMRFHFSLNDNGFLFLGRSEMTPEASLFTPVNLEHRVFAKIPGGHMNAPLLIQAFRETNL
jgi:chemotaxis methyl-accepting protein methylase